MTIGQLEDLINNKPDNLSWEEWRNSEVLIPMNDSFDGLFFSPCEESSGYAELPSDIEDTSPHTLVLVPCGFFDEDDNDETQDSSDFHPELN